MEIFSNKEKNELLKEIANATSLFRTRNEKDIAMIDDDLYPNGFVDILSRLEMPSQYFCEITTKGLVFLEKGGYEAIQKELEEKKQTEYEQRELTRLQAEELNYKKRIRKLENIVLAQRVIEAALFLISIGFAIAYFCLKSNP